jgi:hypothetical protein
MTVTHLNELNSYRVYYKGVKENMLDRCKYLLENDNENQGITKLRLIDEETMGLIHSKLLENKDNHKMVVLAYQDFEITNFDEEDW